MQFYFSIFCPGFKWQKQSDGLIGSVCRSLAHLHVLPRIIFHRVSTQGVNTSKIETHSGETDIRMGKNREWFPSCADHAGSISKCVQADENYRDGHLSSQSIKQLKLYLEKKKLRCHLQFTFALSRFMPKGILSFIVWPMPLGEVFL